MLETKIRSVSHRRSPNRNVITPRPMIYISALRRARICKSELPLILSIFVLTQGFYTNGREGPASHFRYKYIHWHPRPIPLRVIVNIIVTIIYGHPMWRCRVGGHRGIAACIHITYVHLHTHTHTDTHIHARKLLHTPLWRRGPRYPTVVNTLSPVGNFVGIPRGRIWPEPVINRTRPILNFYQSLSGK